MLSFIAKGSLQARPRLAVELTPAGVYAARANDAAGLIAQAARADLPSGALVPSLRQGNIVDRVAVISAVRRALQDVQVGKQKDTTVIVPDSAVRVLMLDFDELPGKVQEALPVVRFRLAKLLPFNPELAQVSYQVMSQRARALQVLAVAIPNEVLEEYESVVREAGFEPGAVLPSTLSVCAAMKDEEQTAALLVNGNEFAVTTAILRRGELLLHRTLDLKPEAMADAAAAAALDPGSSVADTYSTGVAASQASADTAFPGPPGNGDVAVYTPATETVQGLPGASGPDRERAAMELLQSISVAAAYFEDSLAAPPETLWVAGSLSQEALAEMLAGSGLRTRDVLGAEDVLAQAVGSVPRSLLAGLRGALKS